MLLCWLRSGNRHPGMRLMFITILRMVLMKNWTIPTLEEAREVAQKYVAGSMEPDGFAYEGAAVYDLVDKKISEHLW